MAESGVKFTTSEGWVAKERPRPLRNTYLAVQSAVSTAVLESKEKGFCFTPF